MAWGIRHTRPNNLSILIFALLSIIVLIHCSQCIAKCRVLRTLNHQVSQRRRSRLRANLKRFVRGLEIRNRKHTNDTNVAVVGRDNFTESVMLSFFYSCYIAYRCYKETNFFFSFVIRQNYFLLFKSIILFPKFMNIVKKTRKII